MKNKILAFILLLSAFTPTFAEKIEEKDLMAYLFVYFTGSCMLCGQYGRIFLLGPQ